MRLATLALAVLVPAGAFAQPAPTAAPPVPTTAPTSPSTSTATPALPAQDAAAADATYTIGPDDVLIVLFWRDKDTSTEVVVRPDGRITLPLINDVQAAGLTPDQLREKIQQSAQQFFQEPNVSVVVKQVNSRKVFVTGAVSRPGTYPLTSETTVLQIIATAGGLTEYAKKDKIGVLRAEGGTTKRYPFNYKDVSEGKKLEQNIALKPGDTVVVP